MKKPCDRLSAMRAMTLLEMVVVIAIMVMLSTAIGVVASICSWSLESKWREPTSQRCRKRSICISPGTGAIPPLARDCSRWFGSIG